MARQGQFYHGTPLRVISQKKFGKRWLDLSKNEERTVKKIYREVVNPKEWRYGDKSNTNKKFKY